MSHAHHPSSGGSPESIAAGHELTDVKIAPLLQFAVLLTVVVVVTMWGMYEAHLWMDKYFAEHGNLPHPMQVSGAAPAGPRLQVNESKDYQSFQHGQTIQTTGESAYAWIDQPADVVRVPLSRAMELVLKEGLPHRTQGK